MNGNVLVGQDGRPRYWAAVWQTLYGSHLAPSTLAGRLAHIDSFYRATQECFGEDCLDRLIGQDNFERLEAALEGHFVAVQNRTAVNDAKNCGEWGAAFGFVRDLLSSRPGGESALNGVRTRLERLARLAEQFRPSARRRKRPLVRALPANVVAELYERLDPAYPGNPFRGEVNRWRNYALFLLYLHQGLRRSEALLLPANAVHEGIDLESGETRIWLNIMGPSGEEDSRYHIPSLKTPLSARQIPIAADVVSVVEHYVDNHRGRPDTPYLFVSNQGKPLAANSVNAMFQTLTEAVSEKARKSLEDNTGLAVISPHDLRHTCAVARLSEFLERGTEMDVALQNLRAFFGWSPSSDMPLHYSRAYFEDRLRTEWRGKFDDRIGILRQLRNIDRRAEQSDGSLGKR